MSSSEQSEIRVPSLGESIREATIARWLKSEGEGVTADEVLVELETDKVTLEVSAPATGTLSKVHVPKGGTVTVGEVIGSITQGSSAKPEEGTSMTLQQALEKKISGLNKVDLTLAASQIGSPVTEKIKSPVQNSPAFESVAPSVRKLAEELDINPNDVSGSGKGGRVTKGDMLNFSEETANPVHKPVSTSGLPVGSSVRTSSRREERVKMSRLRQRIAERLKHAQNTAAILTTFNEVDMSAITLMRNEFKESFEKKHGVRLGMMSFFVKACIQALKEFPAVNSEIDGDEIIYKNYYDIGVAVSTPQGLVVPVVRNADLLSFAELELEISALALKAKEGKLAIAEMTGGTFTVSNGGVFGSLLATPILNPPQTGILGMHKIQDRVIVIEGKMEIRPMMYLALSYDHRVIDGRESVTFLVKVKENLENPERLMLDM
ncbi:MAG: 2-oxoglutarate dehydrogenase complex dihydrolipoyllysine-residue succinyltransferase [Alphaproteobacteria bacterium]|nr:2-oxoglutarate dehydrogenase complex dihydrolipoyllysine-residue succinyltransferase [Alphaproteobacteria bacterium]